MEIQYVSQKIGKFFQTMEKKTIVEIVAVVIIVLWWNGFLFSDSWRYKMTVVVETPEGDKIGSSVYQVSHHSELGIFPGQGGYYYISRGDAVVVDLGARGLLFAIMQGANSDPNYSHDIALDSFPLKKKTKIGTQVTLDEKNYPMLVHFKNLEDPKSVEAISPSNKATEVFMGGDVIRPIASVFGQGVKVKSIRLEVTDEPIIITIDKWIPWIAYVDTLSGKMVGGRKLYDNLYILDFKRGKNS